MVSGTPDARTAGHDTLRTVQAVLAKIRAEYDGTGTDGTAPETVDPGCNVVEFAATSLRLLQIHVCLEDAFGMRIAAAALFDHETVAALAEYLAGCR
jgi:acyl carrier protein